MQPYVIFETDGVQLRRLKWRVGANLNTIPDRLTFVMNYVAYFVRG